MCVTKLKNDNKISVNVAGYSVCALLDTGSTISTINLELYNKIKCQIDKITFIADLYVLKVDHIAMIIGCD